MSPVAGRGEVAQSILDALGIEWRDQHVKRVEIIIDINEPITAVVTRWADAEQIDVTALGDAVRAFRIKRVDPPEWHEDRYVWVDK